MSREDVVAIGARLLAVYLAMMASRGVVDFVRLATDGGDMTLLVMQAMFLILHLLVATGLWFFPLTVARALLPAMSEPRSESGIGPSLALSLGMTLMGVWFLASSLKDAGYWLGFYLSLKANPIDGFSDMSVFRRPDNVASIVMSAVQFVIGLLLVLGAGGLQRLFYRMRYGKDAM